MIHSFKPVILVWWRYGKEHELLGESKTLRVNSPEIVTTHLDEKIARFRKTPPSEWNWWQVSDNVLVERKMPPYNTLLGADTRFFYLVDRGVGVMTNCHFKKPYQDWQWYLHMADIYFDATRDSWIMKDMFCDIIVHRNGFYHRVLDLNDLGTAIDLGLVTGSEAARILHRTNAVVSEISHGHFPFPEIFQAQEACEELGWD